MPKAIKKSVFVEKQTENAALNNSINNTVSKNHIDNIENDIVTPKEKDLIEELKREKQEFEKKSKGKNTTQNKYKELGYKKFSFYADPDMAETLELIKGFRNKFPTLEIFFKYVIKESKEFKEFEEHKNKFKF